MAKIKDISANMLYKVSEVICVSCARRWLSCRPKFLMLQELECPECGEGFVIETGQEINSKRQPDVARITVLYEDI